MEHIMRSFLWSGGERSGKAHFVRWDKVCRPLSEGGLGIRRLQDQHLACLSKLAWSAQLGNSIWAKWINTRYLRDRPIWAHSISKLGSPLWRKLLSLGPFLHQGSRWIVGNGESISLWYDVWAEEDSFAEIFPLLQFNPLAKVSDIISECGTWEVPPGLHSSAECMAHLDPSHLPPPSMESDRLIWTGSSSGVFSVTSAWNDLRVHHSKVPWWPLAWNKLLSPAQSTFAWRLFHRKTPTDSWAQSIGVHLTSRCSLCYEASENEPHLFYSCAYAHGFWAFVCSTIGLPRPNSLGGLWESLITGCNKEGILFMGSAIIFGLQQIWKSRNQAKFLGLRPKPSSTFLAWRALMYQTSLSPLKARARGVYLQSIICSIS